jgi:hypothetical protein
MEDSEVAGQLVPASNVLVVVYFPGLQAKGGRLTVNGMAVDKRYWSNVGFTCGLFESFSWVRMMQCLKFMVVGAALQWHTDTDVAMRHCVRSHTVSAVSQYCGSK